MRSPSRHRTHRTHQKSREPRISLSSLFSLLHQLNISSCASIRKTEEKSEEDNKKYIGSVEKNLPCRFEQFEQSGPSDPCGQSTTSINETVLERSTDKSIDPSSPEKEEELPIDLTRSVNTDTVIETSVTGAVERGRCVTWSGRDGSEEEMKRANKIGIGTGIATGWGRRTRVRPCDSDSYSNSDGLCVKDVQGIEKKRMCEEQKDQDDRDAVQTRSWHYFYVQKRKNADAIRHAIDAASAPPLSPVSNISSYPSLSSVRRMSGVSGLSRVSREIGETEETDPKSSHSIVSFNLDDRSKGGASVKKEDDDDCNGGETDDKEERRSMRKRNNVVARQSWIFPDLSLETYENRCQKTVARGGTMDTITDISTIDFDTVRSTLAEERFPAAVIIVENIDRDETTGKTGIEDARVRVEIVNDVLKAHLGSLSDEDYANRLQDDLMHDVRVNFCVKMSIMNLAMQVGTARECVYAFGSTGNLRALRVTPVILASSPSPPCPSNSHSVFPSFPPDLPVPEKEKIGGATSSSSSLYYPALVLEYDIPYDQCVHAPALMRDYTFLSSQTEIMTLVSMREGHVYEQNHASVLFWGNFTERNKCSPSSLYPLLFAESSDAWNELKECIDRNEECNEDDDDKRGDDAGAGGGGRRSSDRTMQVWSGVLRMSCTPDVPSRPQSSSCSRPHPLTLPLSMSRPFPRRGERVHTVHVNSEASFAKPLMVTTESMKLRSRVMDVTDEMRNDRDRRKSSFIERCPSFSVYTNTNTDRRHGHRHRRRSDGPDNRRLYGDRPKTDDGVPLCRSKNGSTRVLSLSHPFGDVKRRLRRSSTTVRKVSQLQSGYSFESRRGNRDREENEKDDEDEDEDKKGKSEERERDRQRESGERIRYLRMMMDKYDEERDGSVRGRKRSVFHKVTCVPVYDPVSSSLAMMVVQNDITREMRQHERVLQAADRQLVVMESIFPSHVIDAMLSSNASSPVSQVSQQDDRGDRGPRQNLYERPHDQQQQQKNNTNDVCSRTTRNHVNVLVMFMDMCGFTAMSSEMDARDVVHLMNTVFEACDRVCDDYGMFKLDTVADCYICVGGLMKKGVDGLYSLTSEELRTDVTYLREEALKMMRMAADILRRAQTCICDHPIPFRVGMHVGPVASGVIGSRTPKFTLLGDTMNVASRLESTGVPGCIQVSEEFKNLLPDPLPLLLFPTVHPKEEEEGKREIETVVNTVDTVKEGVEWDEYRTVKAKGKKELIGAYLKRVIVLPEK